MKGLIEKPHFDEKVFKVGTPLLINISRDAETYRSFSEYCLVSNVNKDVLSVMYITENSSRRKEIKAEDVEKGYVKIKFLKSDNGEELPKLYWNVVIHGPQGVGKTVLGNVLKAYGCSTVEMITDVDESELAVGTTIIDMRRVKGETK